MDTKHIFDLIENRKDELFELLGSLIRINSENFRYSGNEKEIAEYIHKLCREMGLESSIYSPMDIDDFENHPDYFPGRNLENRYNVTACWKGIENRDELMLMGHTDTVEIGDLKNWDKDPLSGEVSDGKIWGRGVGDDKYALAVVLFLIKLLKEEGFVPKANLLFAAYCDEEHGGSHGALAAVLKNPCPHIVNIDCCEDQIWHCASGGQGMRYCYHTKDSVSSAKQAADAIPVIMDIIEPFAERRRSELTENRFYAGTDIADITFRYLGVKVGDNGTDLGRGELGFTFYTDKSKEEIYSELAGLEKILKESLEPMGLISDGFIPRTRFFHYVFCEPNSEDITKMLAASREATGKEPIVCGSTLSDLSVISKYGSSRAFGFGLGRDFGKPGGAHQSNEYIECDKLVEFTKTIAAYILRVLG